MGKDFDQTATAPYNFVSLPKEVLASPVACGAEDGEERIRSYREHVLAKGRLSGHIDLEIRTLTPVFVGTGADAREDVEAFFAPAGVPVLPGSSVRGMIKNIFKIVTCGAMRADEDYYDRTLYFRTMADKKPHIRELYKTEMATTVQYGTKTISETKASAGYLIRQSGEAGYYICPSAFRIMDYAGGRQPRSEVHTVSWGAPGSGRADSHTGLMSSKSTYIRHYDPDWEHRIPVPDKVVQAYRDDVSRKGGELLDEKVKEFCGKVKEAAKEFTNRDDIRHVAPCFYKLDKNGNVAHFGFGRFYRIAYQKSISDHVIVEGLEKTDYADAIFGCKELWASRLSFSDALPDGTPKTDTPAFPKILSTPKPTAVQLYLEQKNGAGRIAHWDSEGVPIRGYKLYWHQKKDTDWRSEKDEPTTQTKLKISPVKDGSVFRSTILFERLSEDELGALLKVLCLHGNHLCCKIGKGKSIGLGSIQVKPTLFITDAGDSCRTAFDDDGGWNAAERAEEMKHYIDAFERVLGEKLQGSVRGRYDKLMKELRHILDWENTKIDRWGEKIAQMSATDTVDKRFKYRAILPTALEVGKRKK